MNPLSSVKKGDILEKKVYELFKILLENGDLGVNAERSKIFWKKLYYSEERKKKIEFDVAIETYQKGADNYSTLILFECKNYKSRVPVKDIEAFDSKLNQVGEHNTKGIFISNMPFQEAALNLAKSKGMGVAILDDDSELEWLLYRKEKKPLGNLLPIIYSQLTDEKRDVPPFFGFVDNLTFESLQEMLVHLEIIDGYKPDEKYIKVGFKTDEDIDRRITELNIHNCYDGLKLNTDHLCARMSELYEVYFEFSKALGAKNLNTILGKIDYDIPKIYVSNLVADDVARLRFTLCHEIGHLALHYSLLKPFLESTVDTESSLGYQHMSKENSSRIEIQANMFASQVLLPLQPFLLFVQNYFKRKDIYKPNLVLDSQHCNQVTVYTLLNEIQLQFGVSKEVARIRLKKLGKLVDETENSLNDIFRRENIGQNNKSFYFSK
jgi:Zn-dependent peptidase ImmA (M78 family)